MRCVLVGLKLDGVHIIYVKHRQVDVVGHDHILRDHSIVNDISAPVHACRVHD